MARQRPSSAVRCPACGSELGTTVPPACPWCGVPIGGVTGRRLVTVEQRMAALAAERSDLLVRLRAEASVGVDWGVPEQASPPDRASAAAAQGTARAGHRSGARIWLATAGPQTLLASSGVLLLAIAAVVFAAVAWRDLSMLTRGGVLVISSLASAQLTRGLVRRGLRRSAEATGVLTVALLAVLLNGLWRAGLLAWVGDDIVVATASTALLAAASHALARGTTIRSPLVLAAWFAATAAVTGGQALADAVTRLDLPTLASPAVLAGVLAGAVVAAAYAERHLDDLPAWRDVTQVAAALSWLGAVLGAVSVLAEPTPLNDAGPAVTLLLVGAAVASAAVARRMGGPGRRWDAPGMVGMWFAATIGGAAALVDRVALWPEAAVVVPLAAGAVALRVLAPRGTRVYAAIGMVPVFVMALMPVLAVIAWLGEVISQRLDAPWMGSALVGDVAATVPGGVTIGSALTVVALTTVAAVWSNHGRVAAPYAAAVGGLLVVAAGVRAWPAAGGAIVGLLAVACAAVALRGAPRFLRPAVALVGASVVTAAVALSTPAVTMTTLAAMATAAAYAIRSADRRAGAVAAAVMTADLIGLVAAIVASATDGPGPVAVAVAAAAACGWAVAAGSRAHQLRASAVEATAAAAFACALGVAEPAAAVWSAVCWGVLAVAAAGIAVWRQDRRWLRWVAAAAASASSATVLADLDVRLVEAYTMPPALVIVVLAAGGLRARPTASSWPVLGAGLALLTMPTALQLVDGPADLRRLAMAVALGSALVVAGRVLALQSPLVIGAGVLALAALSQYAVITDVLPRWVLLAAAGTLLLWLSIGYERQRARVSAATRRLVAMR